MISKDNPLSSNSVQFFDAMNPQLDNLRLPHQQILIADAPISEPLPSSTELPTHATKNDPLIAKGGQDIVIFGVVLLMVGVVAIVGFLSRRIEHAIAAALVMSLLLIGFFIVTRH